MAYMHPAVVCPKCNHEYRPMSSSGSNNKSGCPVCEMRAATKREEEYFARLDTMSMEERVRRIERWIYEYKAPSRYPPKY